MKTALLCFSAALALFACSREEPVAQTRIDEARQVEKAADAGKPLSDPGLTQIVDPSAPSASIGSTVLPKDPIAPPPAETPRVK